MIRVGTRVRLRSTGIVVGYWHDGTPVRLRSTGIVVGYWHDGNDPEPDQPPDVPYPYVVKIGADRYLLGESDLEVIEP